MQHIFSKEEREFNQALDPVDFLKKLGFKDNAIYVEGETVRLFCPLHKDQIRRSLIIDRKTNTFKCQFDKCEGHKGGNLLEFYSMYVGIDPLEAMNELQTKPKDQQDKSLTRRADELIEKGSLLEAAPLLEQAIEINPKNSICRCKLASVYLETGNRDEGFKQYLAAAEDFAVKGELETTLSIYNILVMLSPGDIRVRKQLSYLFSRLGRHKEAVDQLKIVVDNFLSSGDLEEATETARRMTELQPDDVECRVILARSLVRQKNFEEGMDLFESAASSYLDSGKIADAKNTVEEAFDLFKYHDGINRLRAELAQKNGENDTGFELAGALNAALGGDDGDEFENWLKDIEKEVERPPTAEQLRRRVTTEIQPEDDRVRLVRRQLQSMDIKQLRQMRQHLMSMFATVRQSHEMGYIQEYELRVIKEFYKSFCKAFETHIRECGISL